MATKVVPDIVKKPGTMDHKTHVGSIARDIHSITLDEKRTWSKEQLDAHWQRVLDAEKGTSYMGD